MIRTVANKLCVCQFLAYFRFNFDRRTRYIRDQIGEKREIPARN